MTPHLRRMQQARTTLLLDQPFFGVLALQLVLIEAPGIPTMQTDGVSLFYSPTFMDTLTQDELIGVIAHEVMHCACGHPWRRDGREMRRWNIACDHAINHVLIDARLTLPKGALLDPQWQGKSSEYVYARLPQDPPQQQQQQQQGQAGSGNNNDPAGTGGVIDAPDPPAGTSTDTGPTEAEWRQLTQQAMQGAKMQGKLPSSLARDLATLTASRVDWRSLLRKYVTEITRSDYTWAQPNRRYLCSGLYLPSLRALECGPLAIAIDTSGSVDGELLRQFTSEVQAIVSEVQPSRVDVLWCDAKLHRVDSFDRGETVTFKPIGGGGTDFRPVFDHYDTADAEPIACLIYLTDLEGSFPHNAPEYPVIWCTTSRHSVAPFGDTVPCLT